MWGIAQGNVGTASGLAANADETCFRMEMTASSGPRIRLLPYDVKSAFGYDQCIQTIITVSRRAEKPEPDPEKLETGNSCPSRMTPSIGTSQRLLRDVHKQPNRMSSLAPLVGLTKGRPGDDNQQESTTREQRQTSLRANWGGFSPPSSGL